MESRRLSIPHATTRPRSRSDADGSQFSTAKTDIFLKELKARLGTASAPPNKPRSISSSHPPKLRTEAVTEGHQMPVQNSFVRLFSPRSFGHRSSPRSEGESPRLSPRKSGPRKTSSRKISPRTSPRSDSLYLDLYHESFPLQAFEIDNLLIPYSKMNADCINALSGKQIEYEAENGKTYDLFVTNTESTGSGKSFFLIDKSEQLGYGASAKVMDAYNLQTGEQVIAKIYTEHYNEKDIVTERQNLIIMGWLRGQCAIENRTVLFMQYFPEMDLLDYLYKTDSTRKKEDKAHFLGKNPLSFACKIKLTYSLIESLLHIHSKNLIHCDIKTDNIRVNIISASQIEVNIIDLGSAIPIQTIKKTHTSSFAYAPPEVCLFIGESKEKKQPYSKASDIYSLGIVIGEIFTKNNFQSDIADLLYLRELADTLEDLKPEEALGLMPDVFVEVQKLIEKTNIESKNDIDEYTYYKTYKDKIPNLIRRLTALKPEERINHIDLEQSAKDLRQLEKRFDAISQGMEELWRARNRFHGLGLSFDSMVSLFSAPTMKPLETLKEKSAKPSLEKRSTQFF